MDMPYSLSEADKVWNRGTEIDPSPSDRRGDRALKAMILADGLINNGGVSHCLAALSAEQLRAATDGYRFFDLDAPADFLTSASRSATDLIDEEEEQRLDDRYQQLVSEMMTAFLAKFQASPDDFAPLG